MQERTDKKRAEEQGYVDMETLVSRTLGPLVERGEDFCDEAVSGNGHDGCYNIDGRHSCAYKSVSHGSMPDNCEQLIGNAKWKIDQLNDACCGFWKRISRLIQVVITEVLVLVLLLLLLIPKIILKIAELILFAVAALLTIAQVWRCSLTLGFSS